MIRNIESQSTATLLSWLELHKSSDPLKLISGYLFHQVVTELHHRSKELVQTEFFYITFVNTTATIQEFINWQEKTNRELFVEEDGEDE